MNRPFMMSLRREGLLNRLDEEKFRELLKGGDLLYRL